MRIDLNSDMGEGFGVYRYGEDEAVLPQISSANVACGFHAGDPAVMRRTVALARQHGVRIGAHTGFPDPLGFGRRNLAARPDDVHDYVLYQLGALAAFARAAGTRVSHVKPHGALYMMALEDAALSQAIVEAVIRFDENLPVYTIAGSETEAAARRLGLQVVREYFADRPYTRDGVKMFGWTMDEIGPPEAIAERAVQVVEAGCVHGLGGVDVPVVAESICVHSDTPGAGAIVRAIRQLLESRGVAVGPPMLAA